MKATAYLDSPVSASRALSASREESAASAMPADGLRSVDRRSFERRRGLAASLVLLACLSQGRAEAQCSVNCNPISGGVSCTVALTQSPCAAFGLNRCTINYPPSQTMVMTTVLSSTNASCVPGATDDSVAMAFHSAGQGLPAQCDFRFQAGRCTPVTACTAAYPRALDCTVDDATDGLPVKLMEFSVEAEDEQESDPDD